MVILSLSATVMANVSAENAPVTPTLGTSVCSAKTVQPVPYHARRTVTVYSARHSVPENLPILAFARLNVTAKWFYLECPKSIRMT